MKKIAMQSFSRVLGWIFSSRLHRSNTEYGFSTHTAPVEKKEGTNQILDAALSVKL